jgi:dihydrofolate reductase
VKARSKKPVRKSDQSKVAPRRVRYHVAVSLDGFIAGPKGEFDWIIMDSGFDFGAYFKQFDTFLLGRHTFEVTRQAGAPGMPDGTQTIVFSRTLRQSDYPDVAITGDVVRTISDIKKKLGKDIWLFGGGKLFRSLLDAGFVDTVELAVIPILLSQGIPLLAPGARSPVLQLVETKTLPSGTVMLSYNVATKRKRKGR